MKTNELINFGSSILRRNKIETHRIDAEIILSNILKIEREILLTKEENDISRQDTAKFKNLIIKRIQNEPIAYILKKKEFWSEHFFVDKNSLIPRPETELLIEPIIKIFKNKNLMFLDVGVGTGCISLSILKSLNRSRGIGIDICKKTLINAKKNCEKFAYNNRLRLEKKTIDQIRSKMFDLIISNPPYVLSRDLNRLSDDIKKFEPKLALDGGNDGLDVIKKIIYKSRYILKLNGILALEIGQGQYVSVSRLLNRNNFREKLIVKDYQNNIRCIFSTIKK